MNRSFEPFSRATMQKPHRSQDPFKVLGVTFTTEVFDIWNINSNEIITKIENLCKQWAKRKLTLIGRITIIKSLALVYTSIFSLALSTGGVN